jgi:hypothetical protein
MAQTSAVIQFVLLSDDKVESSKLSQTLVD